MSMRRYGQLSRSVLRGANAAPYVRSVRRKPPREADWTRLDPPLEKPSHPSRDTSSPSRSPWKPHPVRSDISRGDGVNHSHSILGHQPRTSTEYHRTRSSLAPNGRQVKNAVDTP